MSKKIRQISAAAIVIAAAAFATSASAEKFNLFSFPFDRPAQASPATAMAYAPAAPSSRSMDAVEDGAPVQARFKRQVVDYRTNEAPGTIIIDTPNTYLYLVMGNGKAMRYGIGVGREGFT